MARSTTFAAVLYIVLSTGAHAQLYEFLEALQPIVKSHPAFGDFPAYDSIFTTKKPKTFNRHPTRQRTEEKKERKPAAISTLESFLRDDARKKELNLGQEHTTTRPVNKNSNHRNEKPRSSSRYTAREIHSNSKENSKNPSGNVYDTLLVLDNISNEKRKHSEDKITFVTRTTKRYENSTIKPSYSSESYNKQSNSDNNGQNYYNNYNPTNNKSNEYIQFPNNEKSNNRQTYNNQDNSKSRPSNNQNSQSTNSNKGSNNRQTNNYSQSSNNRPSNNQPSNNQNSQPSEYNPQSSNNNRGTNNNKQTNDYNQNSNSRPSNIQNSQSSEYNSQSTNSNKGSNRHTNYNQDSNNRQSNNQPSNNQNSQSKEYNQPNYNSQSNKPSKNYVLTTQNPFYNRPGVRPAAVDDKRPPITNRPPSRRTTTLRPVHLLPKDTRIPPELITVPGEDTMSEAERLRHIDMSEKICSKYKKLYTKQLQAIPLVPSPEALEINVTSCTPTNIPLIVGGKVVSIKEFPHMALVGWVKLNYDGYSWRCGGSLISDRFVLTAAHCAYEERDNNIVIFSEFIRPACLGVPPSPSESVIATGWGRTEFGGDQSKELRGVSLEVWEVEECQRALGKSRKLPNGPSADSQLCAGSREGGKDTCQGDSGGPAQIQDGCVWRVVAVTSVGRACGAANTPALYAIAHRAFISSVVFNEQSITSEVEQIDLNEQRYQPSRSTEIFNYQTNNWKSQRNRENSRNTGNSQIYNYNQQSNDYANNYEAYNQPYYNDAPTWF